MMHRLLIVGAGVTGSVLAADLLRRWHLPLFITIWDKAKGAGGRMSTARNPKDKKCRADIGAQYLSTEIDNELVNRFYAELLDCRLLRKLELAQLKMIPGFRVADNNEYFACTEGTSAVVKHFLNGACTAQGAGGSVKILYNKRLKHLSVKRSEESYLVWSAEAEDGEHAVFDSVVSTVPVPQALALVRDISGVSFE